MNTNIVLTVTCMIYALSTVPVTARRVFTVDHNEDFGRANGEWRVVSMTEDERGEDVRFSIQVKERNVDDLKEIVERVSDPNSASYGQYMTLEEIDMMTKPLESDLNTVLNWIEEESDATTIVRRGRIVDVSASVSDVEKLLNTRIVQIERHGRRIRRANTFEIPDNVADAIQSVYGLHGKPLPRLETLRNDGNLPAQPANVTPSVLASTYDVKGVDVSGDKVVRQAVAEFQGEYMRDQDLVDFFLEYVKTGYTPGTDDVVYDFVGDDDKQQSGVEASLDIQYIMGVAPKLLTEFWLWNSMDFCGDLKNWTEAILADDSGPLVHSVSYGWQGDLSVLQCEDDKVTDVNNNFVKLAAKGITIVFASGDSGSGYTPAAVNCSAQSEDTQLEGTISNEINAQDAAECCEIAGQSGAKGYTFAPPSGPSPSGVTCEEGDCGKQNHRYVNGTNPRVIELPGSDPNGPQTCCRFASENAGAYFSFVPAKNDSEPAHCTVYDQVTGTMEHKKGAYAGHAQSAMVGKCTLYSVVTGTKSKVNSTSGEAPKHPIVDLFPSWPASSPYVTAVGATRFVGQTVGAEEMASDQFGSGGGFSKRFDNTNAKWQVDAVSAYTSNPPDDPHYPPKGSFPLNGRATPDVSALGEGYQVVIEGGTQSVGGTSASAPAFAGLVSLLNEARHQANKPPMGFINPFLYAHADAFTDVTKGTNAIGRGTGPIAYGFNATKGWDPATGLGTPVFSKLLKAALKE